MSMCVRKTKRRKKEKKLNFNILKKRMMLITKQWELHYVITKTSQSDKIKQNISRHFNSESGISKTNAIILAR